MGIINLFIQITVFFFQMLFLAAKTIVKVIVWIAKKIYYHFDAKYEVERAAGKYVE